MLKAISPIDGRYANKTKDLVDYFSEYGLIRYRVFMEIEYFIALCSIPLPQLESVKEDTFPTLRSIYKDFSIENAQRIKEIESITNHDVKAVEYFIKEEMDKKGLSDVKEFIHFGLTSQDINNTSIPLSLKEAMEAVFIPELEKVIAQLDDIANKWKYVPMLARTHGQPATPTTLGKEMAVFSKRLKVQHAALLTIPYAAKFGGATGNFNAHHAAYPDIDWHAFANDFIRGLGMYRSFPTTQIEHYDQLAAMFQAIKRINTILIDFSRDIWTYVSIEYFKQKVIKGEVGSSAMPHKVNPIDFENAEGNLGIANAILGHLADKLPISRLQRDLTDSTVLRNVGVPLGHALIAFKSLQKGMSKLQLNEAKLAQDLEANRVVVAEAIQTILRREGYPNPYEALKHLTRGSGALTKEDFENFIQGLDVSDAVKAELRMISPETFLGKV